MDRKSKILLLFFVILITGSVLATYHRIFIAKDYVIEAKTDCDPMEKRCFVWQCDPESAGEAEQCTGDPGLDTWYYKIVQRKANHIPQCDPAVDEDCAIYACDPGEVGCQEIYCESSALEVTDTKCSNSADFVGSLEESVEEEKESCNPGREDCEAEGVAEPEILLNQSQDEEMTKSSLDSLEYLPN